MRSVENKQVENFVRNFAIEKLESSKLFTSVYGKRFAKQQMEENVKSVQVESEKSKDYMKYNLADKSIYLLIGKGENLEVNLNDLKKNNEVLFVILHECIHAILRNKKGTGLLEIYENETELGRGLNEGLTNWIADKTSKLGLYINEIEDNIIRELELAIGPKKVMSLGKGNIKKNGTKLLGMTKTEMVEFCKKIDLVYFLKLDIQQYSKIKTILEKSDTTSEQKNSELEKLKENFTAKEILEKKFPKYMKKYGKGTTIEDKLEFAKRMEKDLTETQNEVKESIQISIFNKYFKKEFYENLKNKSFPDKSFDKFNKLYKLFINIMGYSILLEQKNNELTKFLQDLDTLKDRIASEKILKVEKSISKGKFSTKKFIKYSEKIKELGMKNLGDYCRYIAKRLYPERSEDAEYLLKALAIKEKLNQIDNYSVLSIEGKNGQETVILKDGRICNLFMDNKGKNMRANDKISGNFIDNFDFSTKLGEDSQKIIKQFLELKEKISKDDENAEISIHDRLILVKSNGKRQLYKIEDGEINSVKVDPRGPLKIEFQDKRNRKLPVAFNANFINSIRTNLTNVFTGKNIESKTRITSSSKEDFYKKYKVDGLSQNERISYSDDVKNIEISRNENKDEQQR